MNNSIDFRISYFFHIILIFSIKHNGGGMACAAFLISIIFKCTTISIRSRYFQFCNYWRHWLSPLRKYGSQPPTYQKALCVIYVSFCIHLPGCPLTGCMPLFAVRLRYSFINNNLINPFF